MAGMVSEHLIVGIRVALFEPLLKHVLDFFLLEVVLDLNLAVATSVRAPSAERTLALVPLEISGSWSSTSLAF